MMEEQTKQIKRLADSKVTEIEDIGRGNRTEASFDSSTIESSQEQDTNPVVGIATEQTMPPPFSTTHTGPPPPFSGASRQCQHNHPQQQDGNKFRS